MPNIFDTVAVNKVKKSLFNLSHMRKFSGSLGYLMPIQVQEVLPGETFHTRHEALVKLSPLLAPIMQEVDMFIEDFFVPNRLLWDNWNDFITPSDNGTFPAMPYANIASSTYNSEFQVGTLADYLGYPVGSDKPSSGSIKVCTLPFRAYQLIWNEFYRDQNLQNEVDIAKSADGAETSAQSRGLFSLRKRCWPKDYFTSALPTTQRGGDVHIPLEGEAPVKVYNNSSQSTQGLSASVLANQTSVNLSTTSSASGIPNGKLVADLTSGVSLATVNELRRATALQEYLELNMRVGGRINEFIYGNFAQRVPDYRIDRPQFIGGFRSPIVIDPVNQTSATASNATPIAYQAANGIGLGTSGRMNYHSYEHGWLISMFSVLPKASYQQGLPRKFTRLEPLDFANPKFGNLGEQAILNKEIYAKSATPDGTFGYTPRYSEYKYEPSTVHGEFKTTLNYWHMGRIFANEPALNATFVEGTPDTRPFAVETGNDYLRVEVYNRVKALRPLPYYGTPKLI